MTLISRLPHTALRIGAAALLTLALYGCNSAGAGTSAGDPDANLALMQRVMKRVERSYVAPVTQKQLVKDALRGMLTRLDPHSDYMDEEQFRQMTGITRGEFGGIGIELTLEGRVPQVIAPIDGTPAARAGLEPGDRIIKIDGQATTGMGVEEIVEKLRGRPGSRVHLTIARKGSAPLVVGLTRAVIRVVSVKSALEHGGIGYVRISTFTENTPGELARAIARLKRKAHGRFHGFVLDLRNDPGGLLDAAVDVSGDFLDSGTVVTTRGRNMDDDRIYSAPATGDLIAGTPMVVLINSATASAAEIVAGALKDHHRATVMGTRSFGKGSVQSIIPLDGQGALRLTTALYYTPNGRSIQGKGIVPDVFVPLPKDEQVANTVVTYEDDLYKALKNGGTLKGSRGASNSTGKKAGAAEPAEPPIKPLLIGTRKDSQLAAALDYLHRTVRGSRGARRG